MKKIFFGTASVICVALGLSSYTSFSAKAPNKYYWFEISYFYNRQAALPHLLNANLAPGGPIASTMTATPPSRPSFCSGMRYWCLAGFGSTQMTANLQAVKTASGAVAPDAGGAYTQG
jgi:hypothetical protein